MLYMNFLIYLNFCFHFLIMNLMLGLEQEAEFNSLLRFFRKEENPWWSAPNQVKGLFAISIKVKEVDKQFPVKQKLKTPCGRQISWTYVHHCQDCTAEGQEEINICFQCSDYSKHIGHDFHQQKYKGDGLICDCGNQTKFRKQGHCNNHRNTDREIEINPQELKEFIQYFYPLYEILFYTLENPQYGFLFGELKKKLQAKLILINQNCPEYIKMTTQLFRMEIRKENILSKLIKIKEHKELFQRMKVQKDFKFIFAKQVLGLKQRMQIDLYDEILDCIGTDLSVIKKLSKQDLFIVGKMKSYKLWLTNEPSCKIQTQLIQLTYHKKPMLQFMTQILENYDGNYQYLDHDAKWLILNSLLSEGVTNHQFSNRYGIKLFKEIISLVSCFYKGISAFDPYQSLIQAKVQEANIEALVSLSIRRDNRNIQKKAEFNSIIFDKKYAVYLLSLLKGVRNHENFVQQFWIQFFRNCQNNRNQQNYDRIPTLEFAFLKLYQLFNIICNIEEYQIQIQQENAQKFQEQQTLENKFTSFMKKRGRVHKIELWRKMMEGQLKLQTCSQILNKVCCFDEQTDQFIYKYREPIEKRKESFLFPFLNGKAEIKLLQNISQNIQLQIQSQISSQIIKLLFAGPYFLNLLKRNWEQGQNQRRRSDKKKNYGYYYIFYIAFLKNALKGHNRFIEEEFLKIKNESEYRFVFEYYGNVYLILKVLSLLNYQNESPNLTLKEMRVKKKKALSDFYKNGKEKTIQKWKKYLQDDNEYCCICQGRELQSNKLVYLALLKENRKLSHQKIKDSKCKKQLSSCFHQVHIKCYQKEQARLSKCPLCKEKTNCFLIRDFSLADYHIFNKIMQKANKQKGGLRRQASKPQNSFVTLLRHLIKSQGINPFIYLYSYPHYLHTDTELNTIIFQLMKEIYKHQQKLCKFETNEFIQRLKTCENGLFGDVQILFTKAICNSIQQNQQKVDEELYCKIQETLDMQEFMSIKSSLQSIIGQSIKIPFYDKNPEIKKISFCFRVAPPFLSTNEILEAKKQPCESCHNKGKKYGCCVCQIQVCGLCRHGCPHQIWLNFESMKFDNIKIGYENEFRVSYEEGKGIGNYFIKQSALLEAFQKSLMS